jgi:hypothetical protein
MTAVAPVDSTNVTAIANNCDRATGAIEPVGQPSGQYQRQRVDYRLFWPIPLKSHALNLAKTHFVAAPVVRVPLF